MLDKKHKQRVIESAVIFMRAINEAYGYGIGSNLYDTIVSTLDPEIKGEVFFALLTNPHVGKGRIVLKSFNCPGASLDRIGVIREIRRASGIGVKEGMDAIKQVETGQPYIFNVEPNKYIEVYDILVFLGCVLE